tara:strand:+ start:29 stop:406 length:378 start_codon:yes stop_codon:yes gene_type:complete
MDTVSVLVGFIIGLLFYRTFQNILGITYSVVFFKQVEKHCLMMLISVAEAISFIQHIKYKTMVESDVPENTIRLTENIDKQNFELWKSNVITNLTTHYPKSIPASFKTWEEALKLLNKIYDRKRA